MTYGMTKEQMIAANSQLIQAVQAKESQIARLEADVERLRSIHHEKCSIATGDSDVCDCQLNAGRVWLAKAYNGASARLGELARHLDEQHDCPDHCTSAPEKLEEDRLR